VFQFLRLCTYKSSITLLIFLNVWKWYTKSTSKNTEKSVNIEEYAENQRKHYS
jgi:hypothetical protein